MHDENIDAVLSRGLTFPRSPRFWNFHGLIIGCAAGAALTIAMVLIYGGNQCS